MRNPSSSIIAIVPLLLALGCSSDDRTTAPVPLSGQPFAAGGLSGITLGPTGPSVATNGAGALITAIPGQFTQLRYRAPGGPTSGAYIYFSMLPDPAAPFRAHIYRIGLNGIGFRRLTSDTLPQLYPSVSPDGSQVVFLQTLGALTHADHQLIFRMQSDGSGLTSIGGTANARDAVAWIPGVDSLLYTNAEVDPEVHGLYQQATVRSLSRRVTTGDDIEPTIGTINGEASVVFVRRDSLIRVNRLTGDSSYYFSDPSTARLFHPKVSPDNTRLLYWKQNPGGVQGGITTLMLTNAQNPQPFGFRLAELLPDSAGQPRAPGAYAAWTPDGKSVVASLPSESPDGAYQLYVINPDDADGFSLPRRRLITTLTGTLLQGLSVGPPQPVESYPLIGPGAPLGETASGIVFGQGEGGALTSVVAFRSTDPDSVELTSETGLNSTSPVLSIGLRTSGLTSLAFTNDFNVAPIAVVDSSGGSTINGAIITFDARTGAVALILPFAGSSTATFEDQGVRRVFRGTFAGVYDAHGRNLARGVVREVTFEPGSGTVRSVP